MPFSDLAFSAFRLGPTRRRTFIPERRFPRSILHAMADDPKISPADFLAELKAQRAPGAAPAPESIDDLDLDFSDLPDTPPEPEPSDEDTSDSSRDVMARIDASLETAEAAAQNQTETEQVDEPESSEPQTEADLTDLFERVHTLLGEGELNADEPFRPRLSQHARRDRTQRSKKSNG